jgi:hypothetical protein
MQVELVLKPKMGLIPEVSVQNYESLAKALREYVTNALDASAGRTWVNFTAAAGGKRTTLDIRDDGVGMTLDQLREEFLAVGGSKRYSDPAKVGRIGIGFLAVVPFCRRITILTKCADEKAVVRAVIETERMLPEGVRFEDIGSTKVGTAEILGGESSDSLIEAFGKQFTLFTLEDLNADVTRAFVDPDGFKQFREELRRILPLPWPDNAPLKAQISGELWRLMKEKANAHSLKVFLNDSRRPLERRIYGENESRETFLYVQEFRDETIIPEDSELGQIGGPVTATGFFVCDEPSTGRPAGQKLTGISTRILNVVVEESTYFGLEGREERKKRTAGEVFIEGFDKTKAIQINRNALTETHRPVAVFRKQMSDRLQSFFGGMNRIWRARSDINRDVRRIQSLVGGVNSALTVISKHVPGLAGNRYKGHRAAALMAHPARRRFALLDSAGQAHGLAIRVDPAIPTDQKLPYRIELDKSPTEGVSGTLFVSPALLEPSRVSYEIGGVTFGLRVVDGTLKDPPCAIDVGDRMVVVNQRHPLIASGDETTVRIVVYLTYARAMSETVADMEKMVLELLSG